MPPDATGSRPELSLDDIRSLLAELGRRLQDQGVEASLYVVGGAAVAFTFDSRRVTEDIDAVLHPAATVRAEARAMAEEHGLPTRWLNDAVRARVPGADHESVLVAVPGLSVAVASPRHLLAMKMVAFRPQDRPDLELLFRELEVRTPEDAADIAIEVYGEHQALPGRAELLLCADAVLRGMRPRAPRARRQAKE